MEERACSISNKRLGKLCLYCSLWQDVEARRVLTMIETCLEMALVMKSSKFHSDSW